jgi:uncharacterized protein YjiS (DUF1127 family)
MSTAELHHHRHGQPGAIERIGHWAAGLNARIRDAVARHRVFTRTYDELAALTNRDLSDLGIARCDIRRIALDAAYGPANHGDDA